MFVKNQFNIEQFDEKLREIENAAMFDRMPVMHTNEPDSQKKGNQYEVNDDKGKTEREDNELAREEVNDEVDQAQLEKAVVKIQAGARRFMAKKKFSELKDQANT